MAHYSLCFDGGLGDVFRRAFEGGWYSALDFLNPEDTVDIHIVSHNPFAHEFFEFHPKRNQFNIKTYPFKIVQKHEQIKEWNNIPQDSLLPKSSSQINIYPSAVDIITVRETIKELGYSPYIVISANAGSNGRNIPVNILKEICRTAHSQGVRVVGVGRSYVRVGMNSDNNENVYGFDNNVVDLVDKLTVQGVAYLISRSKALVACHSSVCLMNWYMLRKPNLILFPNGYAKTPAFIDVYDPKEIPMVSEEVFLFGKYFKETIFSFFRTYKNELMTRLLTGVQ
jgi:ADP-heptose:LPS heptosyltransferase